MSNSECIVHYPNQKSYSTLKKVSQINKERLCAAKEKRIKLGGNLHHESQCESIPDDIIVDSHHIHLDPCYKRSEPLAFSKHSKASLPV